MKSVATVAISLAASTVVAQSFQGLGTVPGQPSSRAAGLSGDGTMVTGSTQEVGPRRAWRWTQTAGITAINTPSTWVFDQGVAVSQDGAIVAGYGGVGGGIEPSTFLSSGGPPTIVSDIPRAADISRDSLVVIGDPSTASSYTLRWTAATGVQSTGPVLEVATGRTSSESSGAATNADGSVIVGTAPMMFGVNPDGTSIVKPTPFRWDPVNGARTMPTLGGGLLEGGAQDVTPDGSVIIGISLTTPNNDHLFRWTQSTGYQIITPVVPLNQSFGAPRVSADGNAIIAGLNYWSPSTGAITIQQLLTQSGCNFTGWTITGAVGISDDGRTIAGNGTSPTGQTQAWIATVPSPGGGLVIAAVLAHIARRRR